MAGEKSIYYPQAILICADITEINRKRGKDYWLLSLVQLSSRHFFRCLVIESLGDSTDITENRTRTFCLAVKRGARLVERHGLRVRRSGREYYGQE